MKKVISLFLTLILFIQVFQIPVSAAEIKEAEAEYAILTLSSPYVNGVLKKKCPIVEGEVLIDAGTLADLTGYECTYWGETLIFDRGFRRIAVKPDGKVRYYYTDTTLQLSRVIDYNGYVYIPFSAGLKMLGCAELAQGNTVEVLANNISLVDHYNNWNLDDFVFSYDRDLSINVGGTKVGIFLANLFENGFTYIMNSVTFQGPNVDKYRDAAVYYLTYNNENTATTVLKEEYEVVNRVVSVFGSEFGDTLLDELTNVDSSVPSYLMDQDLWKSIKVMNRAGKISELLNPVVEASILYQNIKNNKSTQQLESLKAVIKPSSSTVWWSNIPDDKFPINMLSMNNGVSSTIDIAEGGLEAYGASLAPAFSDTFESVIGNFASSPTSSVLAGFTIGNTVMQLALPGKFEEMKKYDIIFCLKDMQELTIYKYNKCRERIRNGSTNEEDYIYAFDAMQFLTNSNIAIYQLLLELYEENGSSEEMISYWKEAILACRYHYYASRITLDECKRDTIPTDLLNITSRINSEVNAGYIGNDILSELNGLSFRFSSGAGAWSTEIEVKDNGAFSGYYHDSEAGATGEGFPNGTRYECNFSGRFVVEDKIDDFTYSLKLEAFSVNGEVDEEKIVDGIKIINADAYGFDNADEFLLYLPGRNTTDLPEEFLGWVRNGGDVFLTLPFYGLYNVGGKEGFFSN